jgi:hypothetical protein
MSTEARDSTWSYRISLLLGSVTLLLDAVGIWRVTRVLCRYMGCQSGDGRIIFSAYFVNFSRMGDVA